MNLIKDDELVLMRLEIKLRLGQLGSVSLRFQIEIDGGTAVAQFEGKCRLADLPRSDQRDGRYGVDQFRQTRGNISLYHPCNYGVSFRICKVNLAMQGT